MREAVKKKGQFRRFMSYYRGYRGWFILDLSVALLASVLSIIVPAIVRYLTNMITGPESGRNYRVMVLLFAVILLLYALEALFNYVRIRWGHYLGVWIENDMRKDLFSHLQSLSFSYFDHTKTGTIMSRITNDLFNIAEVAHHCPEDILISVATIIGAYALMFAFSWKLSLISITVLPIMLIYGIIFNRRLKAKNRRIRETIADVNVQAENSIQGIREVKSYSKENYQEKKFESSSETLKNSRENMYKTMADYQAGIQFMRQLYYFVTIVGSVVMVALNMVPVSDLVAFILYVSVVLPPIDRLINFTEQFTQGAASFERFTDIMDIQPEIKDKKDAVKLEVSNGEILFDDVSFRYQSDGKDIVIDHLNLRIPGGKRVALVGESGAGKSTIVSLLGRFYEPESGRILIDGTNICDVTQKSLHESIGYVQQNIFLFDASIRENLLYGKVNAKDEELWDSLRYAHLYDFVKSLPNGLDTEVGERGTRLSGGQRQRLSIARVFLKNPPILIFDEATSSLDTESEALIQSAFNNLSKGRTSIVIAHRLSTVIDSDIIFAIDKGRLVEYGTHSELIEKKGLYYRLYSIV